MKKLMGPKLTDLFFETLHSIFDPKKKHYILLSWDKKLFYDLFIE